MEETTDSPAKRTVVVAHGDFDGIVSAVRLLEQLCIPAEDAKVIFTQPFLIDRVEIPDNIEHIYVVDLAVNNRDPEMTETFIESLGTRLEGWYDHHQGWWSEHVHLDGRFHIAEDAEACACLFGHGNDPLVQDAIATDTRHGELSEQAQVIEHACRADMHNDGIRVAAVKWLLGDWSQREILENAAEKYAEIQKETERLAATYEADDNVATVDARSTPAENFDLTQLLLTGQKIAAVAAMVIHTDPRSGEKMVTVATQRKVNLVEIFGLLSGAPFRVTLPVERLEEAKKILRNLHP